MIVSKMWRAMAAQMNKLANFFWQADPIAQLQYEYDKAVDQMKEGREGLEQYRALVERVMRQAAGDREHVASLEARVKAYLQAGERETAGRFAVELLRAKKDLSENETQLTLHETAYGNNVNKIKHATKKLADLKHKIQKYDAEGIADIKREEAVEKNMADQALRQFEVEMGMVTPETAGVQPAEKELGSDPMKQTVRP